LLRSVGTQDSPPKSSGFQSGPARKFFAAGLVFFKAL
jgi:hypothetical protein